MVSPRLWERRNLNVTADDYMYRLLSEYFFRVIKTSDIRFQYHVCSRDQCCGWDSSDHACLAHICLDKRNHAHRMMIDCHCGACVPQLKYSLRTRLVLAARGESGSPFWCPTCRAQPYLGCSVELGYLCDECRISTRRRLRRASLRALYIRIILPRDISPRATAYLICLYK